MIWMSLPARSRSMRSAYAVSRIDFARNSPISAARNISSEAISGAAEKIGGLLTAQPAAPVAGRNSGAI
jgi:hypothetical protein